MGEQKSLLPPRTLALSLSLCVSLFTFSLCVSPSFSFTFSLSLSLCDLLSLHHVSVSYFRYISLSFLSHFVAFSLIVLSPSILRHKHACSHIRIRRWGSSSRRACHWHGRHSRPLQSIDEISNTHTRTQVLMDPHPTPHLPSFIHPSDRRIIADVI